MVTNYLEVNVFKYKLIVVEVAYISSYLPRLFKKYMLTDPEVFLKIISQNQDN